jgi:transcriptional regulator with XRE-family HTH domain
MPRLTRLRIVRERNAMSQADLGRAANVAQHTISRLENGGNAQPGTLRRLARVLKVHPSELIGDQDDAA